MARLIMYSAVRWLDRSKVSMRSFILLFSLLVIVGPADAEKPATPITVRGKLLDDSKPGAHCGYLEIWTILRFDVDADPNAPRGTKVNAKQLPVAIPCTEMPREMYSKTAGNAGVLVKGRSYVLTLDGPHASGKWGPKPAWIGARIDETPTKK